MEEKKNGEVVINETEAKAAVFDYLMTKVLSEDFDCIAAVAGDVMNIIFKK